MLSVFLFNCKKEVQESDSALSQLSVEEMQTKVSGWLEKHKLPAPKKGKITANEQLMLLKNNLAYDLATTEKKSEKETFLVIPVKDGFKSRNNEEKNPVNNLVLVLNESEEITHGNVIQYMPAAGKSRTVPKNTFADIFSYRKVSADGTFTVLTTTDYFQYELTFADGALKSIAVPEKRQSQNGRTSGVCIDWYLVTIVTYADGRTERYEDYLYTECYEEDPCGLAKIINGKVMPTECTSGGGTGIIYNDYDEEAEAELMTQVYSTVEVPLSTIASFPYPTESGVPFQWTVVENSYGLWKVTSYDVAKGYTSSNTGSVIYDIEHNGSSISGQTEWNRIMRRGGVPTQPFIKLWWQESSAKPEVAIATNYKSGTITIVGGLYNAVWFVKSVTNKHTVTVQ